MDPRGLEARQTVRRHTRTATSERIVHFSTTQSISFLKSALPLVCVVYASRMRPRADRPLSSPFVGPLGVTASRKLAQGLFLDRIRRNFLICARFAGVVKQVDALDSKSSGPRARESSSLSSGTRQERGCGESQPLFMFKIEDPERFPLSVP